MPQAKYRDVLFGQAAKEKIKAGVDKAADAVKVTLGVTGKNVIIESPFGMPLIADDGATVANAMLLKDKFEDLGASLIKQVAGRTDETAGDGTTTATVLAQAMLQQAFNSATPAMELKEQMGKGVANALFELNKMKRECGKDDIQKVATVSSLDEEVGKLIAEVIDEVGKDGVVMLEETQKVGLDKEVVLGMRVSSGYISPYFINQQDRPVNLLATPVVFVTDKKIMLNEDILPILNACAGSGKGELLIVCEEMDAEALATAIANKMKGIMNIAVIRAPAVGKEKAEWLEDIALLTGAKMVSEKLGHKFKDVTAADFGNCRRCIVERLSTTIVEGGGDKEKIFQKTEELRKTLENPNIDKYDRERTEKRIAYLVGGIGVIKIGAYTDTERAAKRYKVEDALNAAKAAIKEGIVIGGGAAFVKVSTMLGGKEATEGENIVYTSLSAPLRQMAENKGLNPADVAIRVASGAINEGFDFKTGKFGDLFEMGIMDAFKITRLGLENAFSIVSTVLTTEAAMVQVDKEPEKKE